MPVCNIQELEVVICLHSITQLMRMLGLPEVNDLIFYLGYRGVGVRTGLTCHTIATGKVNYRFDSSDFLPYMV